MYYLTNTENQNLNNLQNGERIMIALSNYCLINTHKKNKSTEKSKISSSINNKYQHYELYTNKDNCPIALEHYQAYTISFKSKVSRVLLGSLPSELATRVDRFEEFKSDSTNIKPLGQGLFAIAYKFTHTPYAIKESLTDPISRSVNGDFTAEANNLVMAKDISRSQKLVALVRTERGNNYLISTYISGTKPHPRENPFNTQQLKSFLDLFLELDTRGIYHGDLNAGNCIVLKHKNDGALIDYQFARKFSYPDSHTNDEYINFPSFVIPANAQMFEHANLCFYIEKMYSGEKDFFRNYLSLKSDYHDRRRVVFANLGSTSPAIRYEYLLNKFLKNPTDDILALQALKLQTLYSFREAYSTMDPNKKVDKHIFSAPYLYLETAFSAKQFVDYAKRLRANSSTFNKEYNEFLDLEIKFGQYWQEKMKKQGINVLNWVYRNASLTPLNASDNIRSRLEASCNQPIITLSDLVKKTTNGNVSIDRPYIAGSYYPHYEVAQTLIEIFQKAKAGYDSDYPTMQGLFTQANRKISAITAEL